MEASCIGKLVCLRAITQQDIDELYYWRYEEENQEAKKWNGPYIPEPWMSKEAFFETKTGNQQEILPGIPRELVIEVDGEFIGTVSAYWIDKNTNWLETGIVIYNPYYWNGGYGTEAYSMWLDFLFKNTHLHRLGMSTWSGNLRMVRLAKKLGMKEEACIRKARKVDNQYYDAVKMGVLREEWSN